MQAIICNWLAKTKQRRNEIWGNIITAKSIEICVPIK